MDLFTYSFRGPYTPYVAILGVFKHPLLGEIPPSPIFPLYIPLLPIFHPSKMRPSTRQEHSWPGWSQALGPQGFWGFWCPLGLGLLG